MMKRHFIFIGIMLATLLLILSTLYYPGGSHTNVHSMGYDWTQNYISNLLSPQAVNGAENTARPIAVLGVLLLTVTFGIFFVKFSFKIQIKSASVVIRYLGVLATIFGFFTVVPGWHDLMVMLTSALTLLIFFYITVMVLKTNLTWLKVLSISFLLTFYFAAFMYFARYQLEYLPIVQKVIFMMKIMWVIALEYCTSAEDFRD